MNQFYNFPLVLELYNSVTGFELSEDEFRLTAERSWNLLNLLIIKEGFSRKNDRFPPN
ncbi:MAG: aldehyde ferredoxin oxidoreductase C-terminal domain-containing protein [Promethearchaeota archaeon]